MRAMWTRTMWAAAMLVAGCTATDRPRSAGAAAPAPGATINLYSVDELGWLAGYWRGGGGDSVTEELWMPAAGGTMIGVNRSRSAGRTTFFELLRIEPGTDGGVVYLASPMGRQPPTPFRLVALADGSAVFENHSYDYPQRISYRRSGDELHMRIEDMASTRATGWFLERAELP